jgi:methionine-S-sulfoxide reductase
MLLIKQYMLGLMLLTAMDSCYNMEFPMVDEQDPKTDQAQEQTPESSPQYLTATFAGGCFWGTEYVFQQVPGVKATRVGFMGGRTQNPSYKEICYADTNHAEVVQLVYDPQTISYEKLVKVFFKTHDPTTLNRQGPDQRRAERNGRKSQSRLRRLRRISTADCHRNRTRRYILESGELPPGLFQKKSQPPRLPHCGYRRSSQ